MGTDIHTRARTCTREPLTPIPSRFTLSRLYLLQGGSREESCRPRVSLPVIPLEWNDTTPLNCHWPIMTSRTFKILTYGSWGGSSLHLAGDDRCGLTPAPWDNTVEWKCDPSSRPTPDANAPSLVGKFYTDGGHEVKTVKCLVESHPRGVGGRHETNWKCTKCSLLWKQAARYEAGTGPIQIRRCHTDRWCYRVP